ncbi:hypothetical protein ACH4KN_22410 [Streptomyces sp. NPDC017546]|uniref:hypothetical protein n=1 Tax=unclassified Streptomyces TaxID=2593676 RepID=UPI002361F5E2|nr:hypothetical protein [Streptomyces sp. MMBL 11-1]
MTLHTVLVALLCGLVLLMLTAGSVYLCWQHPGITGPVTAGATVAGVLIAAGGVAVAAARRGDG